MATITAADVNKLRQQTGAGMMDCRKALVESDGDFEKAVDYLRKKGQKVAALRSDRETKEGVIIAKTSAEELNGATLDGATVADKINDQVAKIGEKITLSKFEKVSAASVISYIHGNYRMGVLVGFSKEVNEETGKDVAMQIAAMNPIAVDADG